MIDRKFTFISDLTLERSIPESMILSLAIAAHNKIGKNQWMRMSDSFIERMTGVQQKTCRRAFRSLSIAGLIQTKIGRYRHRMVLLCPDAISELVDRTEAKRKELDAKITEWGNDPSSGDSLQIASLDGDW